MPPKKKAPKQPKREEIPLPPKTATDEIIDALVGRGVRPISLWLALIVVPGVVLDGLALQGVVDETIHFYYRIAFIGFCLWTVPYDQVAGILIDIGKIRECLADCAPLMPGLFPYLPTLLPILARNIFQVAPIAGTLAPYLKDMLKYPDFVAKALPLLMTKIPIVVKYNIIEQLGPQFKYMDRRHIDKLDLIFKDLIDQLDELAPYFHIIAPHIVEIALRADKLFPVIHYLLPHAEDMQQHIWWLIPFADIDGFDEFMPYLDQLAPHIDEFAIYAQELLPYVGKMKKHIPILIENADSLLPQLGDAVDYMDPLVYWLSDLLPLANSAGILKSKFLLKAGMPFLRFLPSVPASAVTPKPGSAAPDTASSARAVAADFRMQESRKMIHLRPHNVEGVTNYIVTVDGRYAGEFRYSALRKLNEMIRKMPDFSKRLPPFPGKAIMGLSDAQLEERRKALETFLQYVLSEPDIVETEEFTRFVKLNRRWERTMPMLASPLIQSERYGAAGL